MKYLVNRRGRALAVRDKDAETMLLTGCKEITEDEYRRTKYYPQFDVGPTAPRRVVPQHVQVHDQPTERESFATIAV